MIAGKLDYMKAVPPIAAAVALHEIETKGESGVETVVSHEDMAKRFNQLKNDPLILNVSQSLKGPNGQKALDDALKNNPDKGQAFAALVDSMYQKALLDKQKELNAKKPKEEQKVEEGPILQGNM